MLTIIKNGDVYAPKYLGKKDLLLAAGKIVAIAETIDLTSEQVEVKIIDATGTYVMPGFIDSHVHIIGGGGEGSYKTRTPELMLSDATKAGVTTIIGVIGTDGVSRSMPDLIAKAKGLTEEGITCFVHTGSYQVPINSLTGSIQSDFLLIDQIIGVGEIAISDHRSSVPTKEEIARIASSARVGGMLSGKGGIVNVHVGDGQRKLDILTDITEETDIPITQFIPTHINRNIELLEAGVEYAKKGGRIDFTTSAIQTLGEDDDTKSSRALKKVLDAGVDIKLVTFTSDAQGSLPKFNEKGEFVGLTIGEIGSLFEEVRDAILEEKVPIEVALHVITKNPAEALKLEKGQLKVGFDADLVLVDQEAFTIETVIAKGNVMVENKKVRVKGTFE